MRLLVRVLSGLVGLVVLVAVGLFLWRSDAVLKVVNALFHPTKNANAYGSALVVPSTQGKSGDLQINLQGLTSRLHYVVTLNQGSCNGQVLRTFSNVTADTSGNISNTFALSDFNFTTQPNLWINVHEGDSADGASVVCGQVQVNKTLSLNPTATPAVTHTATPKPKLVTHSDTPTVTTSSGPASDTYANDTPRVRDIPDLPHTGVDTGNDNTYDDYAGHHKY